MKTRPILFAATLAAALGSPMGLWATADDVTSTYIINADFTGDQGAWNLQKANIYSSSQSNKCQEFYNGSVNSSWWRMSQTIKNLPEGVYRFTLHGFTRAEGYEQSQTAVFTNTTDCAHITPMWLRHKYTAYGSYPNDMGTVSTAFYADGSHWLNTVDNIIVTDGTLTIGAQNVGQLNGGNTWSIVGNAKLYQLNGADLRTLMNETLTEANAWATKNYTGGISALNEAITTAQSLTDNALTWSAIKTLKQAIATYRQSGIATATADAPVDVTHLIRNADFESGAAFTTGTTNGSYNVPVGWAMTYGATHTNNNAGIAGSTIKQAGFNAPIPATQSKWAYSARLRWTDGSHITLKQTITLPAGTYALSADMANLGEAITPPTLELYNSRGTSLTKLIAPTTTALTAVNGEQFTLHATQEVTLRISFTQNMCCNTVGAVDNINLLYYGTASVDADAAKDEAAAQITSTETTALNNTLELFVNLYNKDSYTGNKKWNALIESVAQAETTKDNLNATATQTTQAETTVSKGMRWIDAYEVVTQATDGNVTALITNPDAASGTTGWSTTLVNTLSSEPYAPVGGAYFDGGNWHGSSWTAKMNQEIFLPAGYYSLNFINRHSAASTMQVSLAGKTLQCIAPTTEAQAGNIFTYATAGSDEATANSGKGYGWNRQSMGFYLDAETETTLNVLAEAATQYQWFSIDEFRLQRAETSDEPVVVNHHITASGTVDATRLKAMLNADTRSLDLRACNIMNGELTMPAHANPNMVIYAPVGLLEQTANVVCNDVCTTLELTDRKPFNAPRAFTAQNAHYSRSAYMDGAYETICLPFTSALPSSDFVLEEVESDGTDNVKLKATADTELQARKAYFMRYTGTPSDERKTLDFNDTSAYIDAFESPTASGLFGSSDVYTVESGTTSIYMVDAKNCRLTLANEGSWSAPFRACYATTQAMEANLSLIPDMSVTYINSTTEASTKVHEVYDLMGRKIPMTQSLKKGIYIINNKKVVVGE